jgi:hypothetical protein
MLRAQAEALHRRALKKPPRARRFIPPGISVDAFLSGLTEKGVRYAVLRWFDTLPEVEPSEDIDILIADEDLAQIEPLLSNHEPLRPSQKIDLYSVTGLRGTDYRGVPYFPKNLAAAILDNAVLLHDKYKVPAPLDHFNSLAFHAAYHKGEASGLSAQAGQTPKVINSEHNYKSWLTRLSAEVGQEVEITLDGLDRYLTQQGLRPPADLLERYQRRNQWLQDKLAAARPDIGMLAGLIGFFVRERAVPLLPEIECLLEKHGFEVLQSIDLVGPDKERVREQVRGGNWGQGPYPLSGGDPACLILAYDFNFRTAPESSGELVNRNSMLAKQELRRIIEARLPPSERFNPLHSTDHGWQTLESLHALHRPHLLQELQAAIDAIERGMALPWPILERLSSTGRRARVQVIDHPVHGRTVAKIFRPSAKRFFERELRARTLFKNVPAVPRMLDHGANWLLMPLYHDTKAHIRRSLPGSRQFQLTYAAMKRLATLVGAMRNAGLFLLDLSSHNLLTDKDEGLVVLDFEFLQDYFGELPSLRQDYTIVGEAPSGLYDAPVYEVQDRWDLNVRTSVFQPGICGVAADEFFKPRPELYLRAKMSLLQTWWYVGFAMHWRWRFMSRRRIVALPRAILKRLIELPTARKLRTVS